LKETEPKIAPEVHQAVLTRLKQAEAKASQPSPEISKLRSELKERDETIAQLTKELNDATWKAELLTKDLSDAKGKTETVTIELRAYQSKLNAISEQLKEQTKKLNEMVSLDRRNTLRGYIRQFEFLEKNSALSSDSYVLRNYVNEYNDILSALKKELPSDNYVQRTTSISSVGTTDSFVSAIKSGAARLKLYLEQRYLDQNK
jgi:chromosome segregation ATPase